MMPRVWSTGHWSQATRGTSIAGVDLETAIRSTQDPAKAHWLLARLQRQTAERNHVQRLRNRLAAAGSGSPDAEYLNFALFKELDDLGEHAGAWSALEQGGSCVRRRLVDDGPRREKLFDAIRQRFPLATSASVNPCQPVPIFIVGMQRSGTTLLEAMLGAHPEVFAYGESQRLSSALRYAADHYCQTTVDEFLIAQAASIDLGLIAEMFLREGRALSGSARYVTEKLPDNFQLVGFIRHALPHAKVVHLRRDAMDLCFANLRELFGEGVTHSYSIAEVARFHALYQDLMRHWHDIYPGFILDVDYEDLVDNPAATSRRVFEFCGLQWDPRFIDPSQWSERPIATLSAVQARGPVSRASVGRWRPYADWLQPLQDALAQPKR